ncbi:MAG: hypothetical protein R3C16_12655 [Hyphomonadaceae bacterium]
MIARLAALILLALGATAPAMAQPSPSETRRFSGVYVDGWEVQLFIENGRETEQPYWIALTPAAREALSAVLPGETEPGEGIRVRITFDGRLSPPGRYGHLGAYPHTVLVETVIRAELESRPTAFCDAEVDGEWRTPTGERFSVTASTSGPNCRQSVALLIVRDGDGDVVWTDARPAAHVMGLNAPTTRTPMERALRAWIEYGARGETTADLPAWTNANAAPRDGEFEFTPGTVD